MNGISMKGFGVRSFMINGLTAKWGIGENRVPPIWDMNLIGYWDARDLPNGAVSTVANKATLATKAPDLTVTGATMVDGTLQFDGVDDYAETAKFMFPERFTVFWDVDWLGNGNPRAGITHPSDLYLYNYAAYGSVGCYIKSYSSGALIPTTSVGLSTNGNIYAPDGSATPSSGIVGTTTYNNILSIARRGEVFTQLGFRQLLIFNKELTQAEVNNVLTRMFLPQYSEDFTGNKWIYNSARATATIEANSIHITNVAEAAPFLETQAGMYGNATGVRVSGLNGNTLRYRYKDYGDTIMIATDGVYNLPKGSMGAALNGYNGFTVMGTGACDITLKLLPL